MVIEVPEFKGFPKLSRLFRTITVTEKIDGTNACVVIEELGEDYKLGDSHNGTLVKVCLDGNWLGISAQSRKRLITPEADNYGFAQWVIENATELAELGPGYHFGEWWGKGIQRNYEMSVKAFSLFNPEIEIGNAPVRVVPVLYQGEFDQGIVEECLANLKSCGSEAAPGFDKPEGLVVYHHHGRHSYKITLDDEDKHKWEVE